MQNIQNHQKNNCVILHIAQNVLLEYNYNNNICKNILQNYYSKLFNENGSQPGGGQNGNY